MKLKLNLEEKDFESFKSFEKAIKKQFGKNCYVGTDNLCLYFQYPTELKAMLRPYPEQPQYNFELDSDVFEFQAYAPK